MSTLINPRSWYLSTYRHLCKQGIPKPQTIKILEFPSQLYLTLYNYEQLPEAHIPDQNSNNLKGELKPAISELKNYEEVDHLIKATYLAVDPFKKSKHSKIRTFAKRCFHVLYTRGHLLNPYYYGNDYSFDVWKKDHPVIFKALPKIYHTAEEWEEGTLHWEHWRPLGYGGSLVPKPKWFRTIHILPKSEYDKIQERKKEIFEDRVQYDLEYYISEFERRRISTNERNWEQQRLREIELVKDVLLDRPPFKLKIVYNKGKILYSLQAFIQYNNKNEIAEYYDKYIIGAEVFPYQHIDHTYIGVYDNYSPLIMTYVLVRYLYYLEDFSTIKTPQQKQQSTQAIERLEDAFYCIEDLEMAFKAMRKLEIIDDNNMWRFGGKKGVLITVVDVLRTRDRIKPIGDDYIIVILLAKRIGTLVSKRSMYNFPDYTKPIKKSLKAMITQRQLK